MIHLLENIRSARERGFTLVELLVVILIIGILAAVAIPMFMNQRKSAVESTMAQDLKNAATILEGSTIKGKGKYPAALPDYSQFSEGNSIVMLPAYSNTEQACLLAKNASHPELSIHYSTVGGGILPAGQTCAPTEKPSYADENSTKKVAIIRTANVTESEAAFRQALLAQGYLPENITSMLPSGITTANMGNYDMLIFARQVWHITPEEYTVASAFYDTGGRVIIEGNDNHGGYIPRWLGATTAYGPEAGSVYFNPIYNAPISPSFPYTFSALAFASDGWLCVKELKPGTHALAYSMILNGTQKCITMAGSSEGNGRMVYIVRANLNYPTIEVSPAYAAIAWMGQ